MIRNIIVHIDTPVTDSNYAYDKLKYEGLTKSCATHDFHTVGINFIAQKYLDNVDAIVLRYLSPAVNKDVYVVKHPEGHDWKVQVYAIVGEQGKKHQVAHRLISRGHSLMKMFLAGMFDDIKEEWSEV